MPGNERKQNSTSRSRSYSGSSGGSSGRSGSANRSSLHNAAEKMRSGNPEERSEGASELGKAGGHQSHKND